MPFFIVLEPAFYYTGEEAHGVSEGAGARTVFPGMGHPMARVSDFMIVGIVKGPIPTR